MGISYMNTWKIKGDQFHEYLRAVQFPGENQDLKLQGTLELLKVFITTLLTSSAWPTLFLLFDGHLFLQLHPVD